MSLPVFLSAEAQADFEEAYDWYERKQSGLGDQFEVAVREAKNRIAELPLAYAKVWGEARCIPVRKFKLYVLHYLVEVDRVVVFSVFHSRRNPRVWKCRVR